MRPSGASEVRIKIGTKSVNVKNGSFRFISNSMISFEKGLSDSPSFSKSADDSKIISYLIIPNCDKIRPFLTKEVLFSILYE